MKQAAIGPRKPRPRITLGRWGGLDTVLVSGVPDDHEDAPTLVLLHGFGGHPMSPGLLHAAKLAAGRGSMRVFIPPGCERYGDGRAWWGGDGKFWPAHSSGGEDEDAVATPGPVARARRAVQGVLKDVRGAFGSNALLLAGYSQGAMLAVDVALSRDPMVDRIAVLAGRLLSASLRALRAPGAIRMPVFMAHGRGDDVVPFAAGKLLRTLLAQNGHVVTWREFRGGHRWPPVRLLHEMVGFLTGNEAGRSTLPNQPLQSDGRVGRSAPSPVRR